MHLKIKEINKSNKIGLTEKNKIQSKLHKMFIVFESIFDSVTVIIVLTGFDDVSSTDILTY